MDKDLSLLDRIRDIFYGSNHPKNIRERIFDNSSSYPNLSEVVTKESMQEYEASIFEKFKSQVELIKKLSGQAYQDSMKYVKDAGVTKFFRKMDSISTTPSKLCMFLERNPDKISSIRQLSSFFNEKVITFANTYHEILEIKEFNEETFHTKKRLESSLANLSNAYKVEYENIKRGEYMDVNADIDVVEMEIKRLLGQ